VRAIEGLSKAEITTVSEFVFSGPDKLCKVNNIGRKTICEISNAIKELSSGISEKHEDVVDRNINQLNQLDASGDINRNSPSINFENIIKSGLNERVLNMRVEELNLSVRAFSGLSKADLKTVKDIINFGFCALLSRKNMGRKTIKEIEDTILTTNEQSQHRSEISFVDAIERILSGTPKYINVVKARYGYTDGKKKTLETIGNELGITRERVRQITTRELKLMRRHNKRKALEALIENIERLLLRYKGIVSINDIAKDNYFIAGTHKQLRFLINLISELYEERYRILDKYFLTSLSNDEIKVAQSNIRRAVLKCSFPIDENSFMDEVISSIGPISKDYLSYHLLYKERIEISKGKVLSPGRLSVPQRVKLLLRDINKPMHFTEIAKLYRDRFGDLRIRTSDLERAIHTRIGDSKDFIIVEPGTFMLRDKFKIPANIEMIVEMSKEILQDLKSVSDTRYLINELKRRNIDVGNLNAYSLKNILFEYPGFVSYRKFEIGIEELADKYERKTLSDLIYEILVSASKPMHLDAIWKQILKQRGFPRYAIDQRLADESRFIRVAPATYTVAKNIPRYEEKQKIIIDFAKEWITLKKNAISAFLISEVLKETSEIKDLPLGLVEHVLATSPEFVKLPNGFYDLSKG